MWPQVGLDKGGGVSEEWPGASTAETGWLGSAQNKLVPGSQKKSQHKTSHQSHWYLFLKHTCSHGNAGCAPDSLNTRLKLPLSLQQHLDLQMFRRPKQKSHTHTLQRNQQKQQRVLLSASSSSHSLLTNLGLEETQLLVLLKEQLIGVHCPCLIPASVHTGGMHHPWERNRVSRTGGTAVGNISWMAGGTGRSRLEARRSRWRRGVFG